MYLARALASVDSTTSSECTTQSFMDRKLPKSLKSFGRLIPGFTEDSSEQARSAPANQVLDTTAHRMLPAQHTLWVLHCSRTADP